MALYAVNLGDQRWHKDLCGIADWIEDYGDGNLATQLALVEADDKSLHRKVVDLFCSLPEAFEKSQTKPSNITDLVSFVDKLLYNVKCDHTGYRESELKRVLAYLLRLLGRSDVIHSVTRDWRIRGYPDIADRLEEGIRNPT